MKIKYFDHRNAYINRVIKTKDIKKKNEQNRNSGFRAISRRLTEI